MNIYQRASQFWAVLVYAARGRMPITREELGKTTVLDTCEEMEESLKEIEVFCKKRNLPPLTDIINDEPGMLDKSPDWDTAIQKVADFPWDEKARAFEKFLELREKQK